MYNLFHPEWLRSLNFYDKGYTEILHKLIEETKKLRIDVNALTGGLDITELFEQAWRNLIESGYIDELTRQEIEKLIQKQFSDLGNVTLNFHRLFRRLHYNGSYNAGNNGVNMQGSCYCNHSAYKYAIYYQNGGTSSDNGFIEVLNSNGDLIKTITVTAGHGNAMCYANGYLYLVVANIGGQNVDTILKIDIETGITVKTIHAGHYTSGIAYDSTNDKFYLKAGNTYYKVTDNDNFTNELMYTVSKHTYDFTTQNFAIRNDVFYELSALPNEIVKIDIETGTIIGHLKIDEWYGAFHIGEVEDLSIIDDDLYLFTDSRGHFNSYNIAQVFHTNLALGDFTKEWNTTRLINRVVYVGTATSNNPDGTQSNPFSTLSEVGVHLLNPFIHATTINLSKDCIDEAFYFFNSMNIRVNGNNHKVLGVQINGASNVMLNELTIINDGSFSGGRCIYAQDTTLTLQDVTMSSARASTFSRSVCYVNIFDTLLSIHVGFTTTENQIYQIFNNGTYEVQKSAKRHIQIFRNAAYNQHELYHNVESSSFTLNESLADALENERLQEMIVYATRTGVRVPLYFKAISTNQVIHFISPNENEDCYITFDKDSNSFTATNCTISAVEFF